jgi:hypothetical protein
MGVTELRVGSDAYRCEIIKRGFGPNLDDWHEEGLGRFRWQDGHMIVDAREGGYSAFYRRPLPAGLLVRFTVRTLPPEQQNNINLISHCQPPQPGRWPIVELGRYPGYRTMPNYIVTFVGAFEQEDWSRGLTAGRTRLRRDPGFELIQETTRENVFGREYEITFAARAGRIRYYIDGRLTHDWQDPAPITGEGYFALRTFSTVLDYSDILFARQL